MWMHVALLLAASLQQTGTGPDLPVGPLRFGAFTTELEPGGTLRIEGEGWPTFAGSWSEADGILTLSTSECDAPGRYRLALEGTAMTLALVDDPCPPRRMILDRSEWRPADEEPIVPERELRLTQLGVETPLPEGAAATGSWPSFRGPRASGVADGEGLPVRWDVATGENVLWKARIPGLAHSSPIVWGDTIFVTTAVSSSGDASFRPGLYGDGDASDDRAAQSFELHAIDRSTGRLRWKRVAKEAAPVSKRHVKSTYASATPATDGRVVVATFGSEGLYAYDVEGRHRWSLDLGHLDLGAYDVPTFEWGPASSPILWRGRVFVQCDTQQDSFVLALDAASGELLWKADRDELPSWGTPTVYEGEGGPALVTNAPNLLRGYDPEDGRELWRLGGSSKITAPTPVFDGELIVVASGRRPEQPIFVVRGGARGDLTLPPGKDASESIAWSRTRRGPYMPTPLIYDGRLYVLANNGIFDAYDLASGEEVYRARVPHLGSGFSASPVASDGHIYLSNEDGDVIVVRAGDGFDSVAVNSMGELLMATPAISQGVLYIRSSRTLFAIANPGD